MKTAAEINRAKLLLDVHSATQECLETLRKKRIKHPRMLLMFGDTDQDSGAIFCEITVTTDAAIEIAQTAHNEAAKELESLGVSI